MVIDFPVILIAPEDRTILSFSNELLNSIMSPLFAMETASRKDPVPESAFEVTIIVVADEVIVHKIKTKLTIRLK